MAPRRRARILGRALARVLDRIGAAAAWLALPLALLLFAQWPLRDAVGAWSRQANDVAQWVFALYVAFAIREASRRRAHMATSFLAARWPARWRRRLGRFGEALCVLPWSSYVLVAAAAPTWRSIVGHEAFPDTFNPLYFLVRTAAWLLAATLTLQAIADLLGADAPREDGDPATRVLP